MATSSTRRGRRDRVAFVLSGGGNQGVSQVGMLRALFERNIVPDVVIGTSAGSLNGAAIAAVPEAGTVERLEEIWAGIDSDAVFPEGRIAQVWNIIQRDSHLFSNAGLAEVIRAAAQVRTFHELAIPLRIIATDLDTGEEVVFAAGDLEPALLASAALPGVFPPIEYEGRRLVDGGVVDNVPIWHAFAGPIDKVYVLNVSGELASRATRSPLDVVMRAFTISRNQRFQLELRHGPPGVEVTVLPRPADGRELFDFAGAGELIDEAHTLAAEALDGAGNRPKRRLRLRRRVA